MDFFTILAQTTAESGESASALTKFVPLDIIWDQATKLQWPQAVLAVSFGAVYMLYGWRIFKILVVICFALLGLFAGIKLGGQFLGSKIWGGVAGFLLFAAVSIPLMRWAVSALGAVAGGILTAGIWYAVELPEKYILAGALIGLIAGGMISFIVFKIAVMLFTSFGGSVIIVTGMISLFYHYDNHEELAGIDIKNWLYQYHWLMPLLLVLPTVIGMLIQNKFIKTSPEWSV